MVIIEDSRQQAGKHEVKHNYFDSNGVFVVSHRLPYGDYAECKRYVPLDKYEPSMSIDTKQTIYELYLNICTENKRFKNECVKARDSNCQLIILVENTDGIKDLFSLSEWTEPDAHFNMRLRKSGNPRTRRIEGSRLAKACETMSTRYGVQFLFCTPEESGQRIVELLEGVHE